MDPDQTPGTSKMTPKASKQPGESSSSKSTQKGANQKSMMDNLRKSQKQLKLLRKKFKLRFKGTVDVRRENVQHQMKHYDMMRQHGLDKPEKLLELPKMQDIKKKQMARKTSSGEKYQMNREIFNRLFAQGKAGLLDKDKFSRPYRPQEIQDQLEASMTPEEIKYFKQIWGFSADYQGDLYDDQDEVYAIKLPYEGGKIVEDRVLDEQGSQRGDSESDIDDDTFVKSPADQKEYNPDSVPIKSALKKTLQTVQSRVKTSLVREPKTEQQLVNDYLERQRFGVLQWTPQKEKMKEEQYRKRRIEQQKHKAQEKLSKKQQKQKMPKEKGQQDKDDQSRGRESQRKSGKSKRSRSADSGRSEEASLDRNKRKSQNKFVKYLKSFFKKLKPSKWHKKKKDDSIDFDTDFQPASIDYLDGTNVATGMCVEDQDDIPIPIPRRSQPQRRDSEYSDVFDGIPDTKQTTKSSDYVDGVYIYTGPKDKQTNVFVLQQTDIPDTDLSIKQSKFAQANIENQITKGRSKKGRSRKRQKVEQEKSSIEDEFETSDQPGQHQQGTQTTASVSPKVDRLQVSGLRTRPKTTEASARVRTRVRISPTSIGQATMVTKMTGEPRWPPYLGREIVVVPTIPRQTRQQQRRPLPPYEKPRIERGKARQRRRVVVKQQPSQTQKQPIVSAPQISQSEDFPASARQDPFQSHQRVIKAKKVEIKGTSSDRNADRQSSPRKPSTGRKARQDTRSRSQSRKRIEKTKKQTASETKIFEKPVVVQREPLIQSRDSFGATYNRGRRTRQELSVTRKSQARERLPSRSRSQSRASSESISRERSIRRRTELTEIGGAPASIQRSGRDYSREHSSDRRDRSEQYERGRRSGRSNERDQDGRRRRRYESVSLYKEGQSRRGRPTERETGRYYSDQSRGQSGRGQRVSPQKGYQSKRGSSKDRQSSRDRQSSARSRYDRGQYRRDSSQRSRSYPSQRSRRYSSSQPRSQRTQQSRVYSSRQPRSYSSQPRQSSRERSSQPSSSSSNRRSSSRHSADVRVSYGHGR